MILTLTLRKIHKNGMASYSADNQRSTGKVYFDKKCWGGEAKKAPKTLVIDAEGLVAPEPPKPAAPAEPAADAPATE